MFPNECGTEDMGVRVRERDGSWGVVEQPSELDYLNSARPIAAVALCRGQPHQHEGPGHYSREQ